MAKCLFRRRRRWNCLPQRVRRSGPRRVRRTGNADRRSVWPNWPNSSSLRCTWSASVSAPGERLRLAECGAALVGEAESGGPLIQLDQHRRHEPAALSGVTETLFAAGARDVWLTPIQMKKGRPGVLLSVLARPNSKRNWLRSSSARRRRSAFACIRCGIVTRRREIRAVQTPFGSVGVKLKWMGDHAIGATPEYEDCRKLAEAANVAPSHRSRSGCRRGAVAA